MAMVTLTVTTADMTFPAGTVGGAWHFAVKDATGADAVPPQDIDALVASFDMGTLTGDFVGQAQRLDVGGVSLGPVASAAFTITPPTVIIPVASTLSATVA